MAERDESAGGDMANTRRGAYGAAATGAGLICIAATGGWTGNENLISRFVAHGAALIVGVLLLGKALIYTRKHERQYLPVAEPTRAERVLLEGEALDRLRDSLPATVEKSFSYLPGARELEHFAAMVVAPAKYRLRTEERLEIDGDLVRRRVAIDFRLPWTPRTSVFLPILRIRKGELIDNLSVTVGSVSVSTLPYEEVVAVVGAALRSLLLATELQTNAALRLSSVEQLVEAELSALSKVMQAIGVEENQDEAVPSVGSGPDVPTASGVILQGMKEVLREHYPVVVTVDSGILPKAGPDGSTVVRVCYEETPGLATLIPASSRTDQAKEWLRAALFAPPARIVVSAREALLSKSYHLNVHAPRGYYVGDAAFLAPDPDGTERLISRNPYAVGAEVPYFSCRRRRGMPFAHLYTRGFSRSGYDDLRFAVRFYEELPGSLGRAALVAPLSLLAIWLVATAQSKSSPTDADTVALALALPALAASWLGLDAAGPMVGGSLFARASMAAAVSLSALGVAVFISQNAGRLGVYTFGEFSFLYVADVAWSTLLVLAMLNAMATLGSLLSRYSRKSFSSESRLSTQDHFRGSILDE